MSSLAQALTALVNGIRVKVQGWFNDWSACQGMVEYGLSVFYRHQGDQGMLWSRATADDVAAMDWVAADGGELPEASPSGLPGVLSHLISGGSIRRQAWKEGMSVALQEVQGPSGRIIVITLPKG